MTDEYVVTVPDRGEVLRNRGFRVRVHVLEIDQETKSDINPKYIRKAVSDSEEDGPTYAYEHIWFKFTNAMLAEVEQEPPMGFGGVEQLGEILQTKVFTSIGYLLALHADIYRTMPDGSSAPDWKSGALRMIDGEVLHYMHAMLAAFQLSQGARPEAVGAQLRAAQKKTREAIDEMAGEELPSIQIVQLEGSQSNSGSQDGASSTDPSTSSGS